MSTQQQAEEDRERTIFTIFVEASALPIIASSIRKTPPPAPDILCTVQGFGDVAFELAEILGETFAKTTRTRPRLRRAFNDAYRKLPEAVRSIVEFRLGGPPAVIAAFKPATPPGQWARAIKPIIDTLEERQQTIEPGEFPVWKVARLRMLTEMSLRGANDAELHVSEATLAEDRALVVLQQKFEKQYESAAPVELLAYYDFAPPPRFTSESLRDVREFLRARLAGSRFRRVWLVDCRNRTVILHCGRDDP